MDDRELIAGLDACRRADDLRQPELRAVAGQVAGDERAREMQVRLLRIDGAVRESLHDVPLPVGLEERLVARLHEEAQQATIGDATAADMPSPHGIAVAGHAGPMYSRRKWLQWSGAAAATAAAVAITVFLLNRDTTLYRQQLADGWQWQKELSETDGWQPFNAGDVAQFAPPKELLRTPVRFRDVSSVVGRDAYAYDLTLPGGPRTTLFVIDQAEDAGAPSAAPFDPQLRTMGHMVAYWQHAGAIYVVVVDSDRMDDYRMLLRMSVPVAA
jgi:hypothetical protein